MLVRVIEFLIEFISGVISAGGYPAIVALMAIESACIPLPSEIIMPFSGFLVARGTLNFHLVALAGAAGNLLGGIIAYLVGAYGGRPFVLKYGKFVLIREHELKVADRFFERWGSPTVFASRMLPIIRTYISLPAGISRMNFPLFCLLTFLGSIPWAYLLTYAGFLLGENWQKIRRYTEVADLLLAVLIVVFALRLLLRRRKNFR